MKGLDADHSEDVPVVIDQTYLQMDARRPTLWTKGTKRAVRPNQRQRKLEEKGHLRQPGIAAERFCDHRSGQE